MKRNFLIQTVAFVVVNKYVNFTVIIIIELMVKVKTIMSSQTTSMYANNDTWWKPCIIFFFKKQRSQRQLLTSVVSRPKAT